MSNPNVDLTEVIENSITDSQLPPDTEATVETPEVDLSADDDAGSQIGTPATEDVEAEGAEATPEVAGEGRVELPASEKKAPAAKDDFERIAGMPAVGPMGRENRIPYSRVKKITEKAVNELAETVLGRKLNDGEKAAEVVKAHVAQLPELTAKVTDYETRLTKVGEFENIIQNEPKKFMQMLQGLPQYQGFFQWVRSLQDGSGAAPAGATGNAAAGQAAQAAMESDAMPEPDQELPDGTKVYSLDGLKQLLLWNSKDTERRVIQQVESQYAPIRSEFQQRREMALREAQRRAAEEAVIPQIRQQLAEAATWPMFSENEEEITAALESDPNLSLDGAYRKVVLPKLVADRQSIRQQVLQEVRQAPRSTNVPARPATQKGGSTGPRRLEDVIAEAAATLK